MRKLQLRTGLQLWQFVPLILHGGGAGLSLFASITYFYNIRPQVVLSTVRYIMLVSEST